MKDNIQTSRLYQHLLLVKTRPRIFIGGHDVALLAANLYGWKAHRHYMPDDDPWAMHFFDNFHKFVAASFGEHRKMDWPAMIKAQKLDERAALDLFYQLLDEFCIQGVPVADSSPQSDPDH